MFVLSLFLWCQRRSKNFLKKEVPNPLMLFIDLDNEGFGISVFPCYNLEGSSSREHSFLHITLMYSCSTHRRGGGTL